MTRALYEHKPKYSSLSASETAGASQNRSQVDLTSTWKSIISNDPESRRTAPDIQGVMITSPNTNDTQEPPDAHERDQHMHMLCVPRPDIDTVLSSLYPEGELTHRTLTINTGR